MSYKHFAHSLFTTNKPKKKATVARNGINKTTVTRERVPKPKRKYQGVRISEDQWKVLMEMDRRSRGKWSKSEFIRRSIDEKLERDVPEETLKEMGYIKSF